MISSLLSYFVSTFLISGVLVLYYWVVLRNTKMHQFNRIYLLLSVLFSIVIPFLKINYTKSPLTSISNFPILKIDKIGVEELTNTMVGTSSFNPSKFMLVGYIVIAAGIIIQFLGSLIKIQRLKHEGIVEKRSYFSVIQTNSSFAPFSFMNLLFWPKHLSQETPEGMGIFKHELAHIQQKHSLDKLALQFVVAFYWMNPMFWLIKNELWIQHEFLADEAAIGNETGSNIEFAKMLLYASSFNKYNSVISPFFQSTVKRRLLMLTKMRNSRYSIMRKLFLIPLVLIISFLVTARTNRTYKVTTSSSSITLILDAAHGGKDDGGRGANGYIEKEYTLELCKKILELSQEYNINVITTRTQDFFLSIDQRVKMANSYQDAVLLSVHINQSSAARDNSYQLGINPKSKTYLKSIVMASAIANQLKGQKLNVEIVDHSMAYLLKECKIPCLLIECGNLDDEVNMKMLHDKSQTERLCRNILAGIVDYHNRSNRITK
ncbi:MAG: N-acetylmuramoyl-L-alanine amidase [Chitinophagaceae bacterium]|nr:N-acetylmuramoyl-L-alanine amidase [Chitinophagaceae bacterium]